MDISFIDESLERVPVPEFKRDLIVLQQNFEWMIVKHNHSIEECPKPWNKGEEGEMVIYDPLIYVLMGTGLIWVVALSQIQSHTNALLHLWTNT